MAEPAEIDKGQTVQRLVDEWAVLEELLGGLSEEEWARPALPGWDVHDVVAHVVGGELVLSGTPRPELDEQEVLGDHVKNEIARWNEAWIRQLRALSHAELLDRFRQVTGARAAALRAMTEEEFAAPSWTPAGPGSYGRFMQLRLFDAWMHEQDIRTATGHPGHEDGPEAEASLDEVVGALGYIVGKRAGLGQGTTVTLRLTGPVRRDLHVAVEQRAAVVDGLDGPATVTVSLPSSLFLRLAGGRVEPEAVLDQVALEGDRAQGRQLVTHLAYTI